MECNDCSQLITTLVALLTAALSGFLSYYFAVKKYRKESQENVERWKYEAIWHAHQSFYKLLRFMTDNENADSILVFRSRKAPNSLNRYFAKTKLASFWQNLQTSFIKKAMVFSYQKKWQIRFLNIVISYLDCYKSSQITMRMRCK